MFCAEALPLLHERRSAIPSCLLYLYLHYLAFYQVRLVLSSMPASLPTLSCAQRVHSKVLVFKLHVRTPPLRSLEVSCFASNCSMQMCLRSRREPHTMTPRQTPVYWVAWHGGHRFHACPERIPVKYSNLRNDFPLRRTEERKPVVGSPTMVCKVNHKSP